MGRFSDIMKNALIIACGMLVFFVSDVCRAGDPVEEMKTFSVFEAVDLAKLSEGEVMGERGSLMNFPRGISVQTCYVVRAPAESTVQQLVHWNATVHPELKVRVHGLISTPPSEDDFKTLDLRGDAAPIQWLVEKTMATTAGKSDLQISSAEAAEIAREMHRTRAVSAPTWAYATLCWRKLLKARAEKFQKDGLSGVAPYEADGSSINPSSEIQDLLKENSRVALRFAALLAETPLVAKPPLAASASTVTNAPVATPRVTVTPYWELFDVTSHGTLNMGFTYMKGLDGSCQVVCCEPFSSGGYHASLAFYEFWPIQVAGRPATLVWREDMVSAPALAVTHGIERMASGAIMLQEIKKSIRLFQEDAAQKP